MTALSTLLLGFLLGLKHALDSDHVIAVSTIAAEERSILRSAVIGVWWGLGHMATLLVAALVVLGLKIAIPDRVALSLEALVGVVLLALGLSLLWKLRRESLHAHVHEHDGRQHAHFHRHRQAPDHRHEHQRTIGWRPLLVGMAHGLAGSAALMLLVLGTVSSTRLAVVYIAIFGLGSIVGMALLSLAIGAFFTLAAGRLAAFDRGLRISIGALSSGFGLWIVADLAPRLLA